MSARWYFTTPLLCLVLTCLLGGKKIAEPAFDPALLDVKDGDVFFQHLPGKLGAVIADVTDSPLTHCGMVVHVRGAAHIIEAIGPVRSIPLGKWLKQGDRGHFLQMRLKTVTDEQIASTVKAAQSLLGLPYDLQYELDDRKIYCSELVYKAYSRGADIEVGKKEALGDLNWRRHEKFIRVLAGGELPLDRQMVTPLSIARDPQFKIMYSTFPERKSEPRYDESALAGKWSGDYTIKDLVPATATVEFDATGKFMSGDIHLADGAVVPIRGLQVRPFHARREFSADLRDARDLRAAIDARIRDEGRCILGTWCDDLGNRGVFAFAKQPPESE
jgi:hypothetical protein